MKKLKFLAFLMMGIVACFGLTSCGDDDDDEDLVGSSLVGSWVATYFDSDCGNVTETVTFKKNGSCSNQHKCDEGVEKASGTYTVTGDVAEGATVTIRLKFDDGYETGAYYVKVEGNKLFMINEDGFSLTFTRK